jgi:DNA-binding LytR/AlgR family response regulator
MSAAHPTALIADDEPLLREALARQLAEAWPELEVVAQARNGREAIRQFETKAPDVCFLDVHMPGISGIEAGGGPRRGAPPGGVRAPSAGARISCSSLPTTSTPCRPSRRACSTTW